MKTSEVPQDREQSFYSGHQRACYAVDEQGRYVVVGSLGWEPENIVNGQANDEVRANIAAVLVRCQRGEVSPLAYHMARCQMTLGLLAAYSGFSRLRIYWHLRPKVYARLPDRIMARYANAMHIPPEVLRGLPANNDRDRI